MIGRAQKDVEGDALRALLEESVSDGAFPGAVAHVERLGGPSLTLAVGRRGAPPVDSPVDARTIYDLASLTKMLATTWLAARAVHAGLLALDEQPFSSWPGVTVAHVLAHRAGLPAWLPLFEHARAHRALGLPRGRDLVVQKARETTPECGPDERTLYSDVGFIALGALLEERLGRPLDQAFDEIARPLIGNDVRYWPIFDDGYATPLARVAPTERCKLRARVVHGQVHDENCYAMGGVAGHAGLFGTVEGTAGLARALLSALVDTSVGEGEVLRRFARQAGERPLGFDRVTDGGSTGGALSSSAVGHLGFTGTSVWLDPEQPGGPALFVLLSNRVHPTRENARIKDVRPRFHRAAALWLKAAGDRAA